MYETKQSKCKVQTIEYIKATATVLCMSARLRVEHSAHGNDNQIRYQSKRKPILECSLDVDDTAFKL